MRPSAADLHRALLAPLADERGLDYEREVLDPGNGPDREAFHCVICGSGLLSAYTYPEGFPSADRRTKRRGAKWMTRSFASEGGRRAAVFLAQALATLLAESVRQAGHEADAERQLAFRRLIQEIYPLDQEALGQLEACRAEYRTFDTHEVRREIMIGVETGTGYHRALRDPSVLDGKSPDEDAEMVELQQRYAGAHLRGMASWTAIEMVLGKERFASIKEKLLRSGGPEYEALTQALVDLQWWNDVAKDWQRYAQVARSLP
jgi:hypothetical protein